jgi:hypothetical protein
MELSGIRQYKNLLNNVLWPLVTGLIILLPFNPLNMKIPNGDSGVFAYIGWRILHGEIPYRDIWDHKPPIIYYINALGLALTNNSLWGVWGIELLSLSLSIWLGFKLLKSHFGNLPAVFGTVLWLISLFYVIDGGNLTTEYVLPIQFLCLWMLGLKAKRDLSLWQYYFIGVLTGLSFFTKQNTIGIEVAIAVWLIIEGIISKQFHKTWLNLLSMVLGGVTVVVLFVSFFYFQHALYDFWEEAFVYNFFYIHTSVQSRIDAILYGINYLSITGLFEIGVLGWLVGLILVVTKKLNADILPLMFVALLDFPFEIILVSVSGQSYSDYYLTLLPVLCILAGFACWAFMRYFHVFMAQAYPKIIFFIVVLGLMLSKAPDYAAEWKYVQQTGRDIYYSNALAYIADHSKGCDSIVVWGREARFNFLTKIASPDMYVYQYVLTAPGYTNAQMVTQFLGDIISQKPCYLVDFGYPGMPWLKFPVDTRQIQDQVNEINSAYELKIKFGRIFIYKYKGD